MVTRRRILERPCLTTDYERTDGVLEAIIVDQRIAVLGVAGQPFSVFWHIGQGGTERASKRYAGQRFSHLACSTSSAGMLYHPARRRLLRHGMPCRSRTYSKRPGSKGGDDGYSGASRSAVPIARDQFQDLPESPVTVDRNTHILSKVPGTEELDMADTLEGFAQRLPELYKPRDLSLTELGQLARLRCTHISRFERGASWPSDDTLKRLKRS